MHYTYLLLLNWVWGPYRKLCTSQIEASTFLPPPRAYTAHLTPFLARGGGNWITTHRGWGIWSLASMSCYEINHGGDVKLWWIQRKRLRICGRLVENQRSTQAVFRIWRCLRTINNLYALLMYLSMFSFSLGRDFDSWALPLGREFDMAAILEDRENLEMSHCAKDLHCFFPLSVELFSPWANER